MSCSLETAKHDRTDLHELTTIARTNQFIMYLVRTLLSSRCRIIVALADVTLSFALPAHGYVVCINFSAINLLVKHEYNIHSSVVRAC
jgi:hypothetical protein